MLAVKYHHLRTLIHRPYLCYPILRNTETVGGRTEQTDWPVIGLYERICINEARAIARLFHNVSRQQDLVQDFPWWQIISCLFCAGSILLVSSIFTRPADDTIDGLSPDGLADDAETCLQVFEALGANSTGARIARDMMEKLKEYGRRWSMHLPRYPPQPDMHVYYGLLTVKKETSQVQQNLRMYVLVPACYQTLNVAQETLSNLP